MPSGKKDTTASEEIERKYSGSQSLSIPPLADIPGVDTVDVDEFDLSARYYDTDDLRLLRAKITLRRRDGGDDAGWHAKLPSGTDTRTELHRPFDDSDIASGSAAAPVELSTLLRSVTRNSPLGPAAVLATHRQRHRLRDPHGVLLAELVVDDVTATRTADDTELRWREIEVEVPAGTSATVFLDVVEEHLTAAGIARSASPSKLHHVLGDLLPAAEKTHGGAGYLRDYIAKELYTLTLSDIAVRRDAPDGIHNMRKAARRLRSALQTYAEDFPEGFDYDTVLVGELRWLGQRLSPSRDLEVQHERLTERVADIPLEALHEPTRARIDEFFTAKAAAARIEAIDTLDSERYLALLQSLDTLLDRLVHVRTGRGGRKDGKIRPKKLAGSLRGVAAKVSKRVDRVGKAPTPAERDERMHEARKGAKRLRYAIEVIAPQHPKKASRALEHFDEFQDMLGEFQDSVVAREHLRDIASEQRHSAESSFGLGIMHQIETTIGEQQAVHLDKAWKRSFRAARHLWT